MWPQNHRVTRTYTSVIKRFPITSTKLLISLGILRSPAQIIEITTKFAIPLSISDESHCAPVGPAPISLTNFVNWPSKSYGSQNNFTFRAICAENSTISAHSKRLREFFHNVCAHMTKIVTCTQSKETVTKIVRGPGGHREVWVVGKFLI